LKRPILGVFSVKAAFEGSEDEGGGDVTAMDAVGPG